MRTYVAIVADMRDEHTFSNGSQYEYWAARWCYRCRWDRIVNPGEQEPGCNIVGAAIVYAGRAPAEWTHSDHPHAALHGDYVCSEFDEWRDGDHRDDPVPPPAECDGQTDIIDLYFDTTAMGEFTKDLESRGAEIT